jgi:hypothetical protein
MGVRVRQDPVLPQLQRVLLVLGCLLVAVRWLLL